MSFNTQKINIFRIPIQNVVKWRSRWRDSVLQKRDNKSYSSHSFNSKQIKIVFRNLIQQSHQNIYMICGWAGLFFRIQTSGTGARIRTFAEKHSYGAKNIHSNHKWQKSQFDSYSCFAALFLGIPFAALLSTIIFVAACNPYSSSL